MAEGAGKGQMEPAGLPINAIFSQDGPINPEFRTALVSRVLNSFPDLPESARQSLRSAVNDEIALSAGGFRRGQAGRALDGLRTILQEPIETGIQRSSKLACAVFMCWAESHASLREESERYLVSYERSADGPDLAARRFRSTWSPEEVESTVDDFSKAHGGYSRDDMGLMLCYVSGNFPLQTDAESEAQEASETLSEMLKYLQTLPATSSLWESVIPNFVASVSRVIEEKAAQLRWASDFDSILEALRRDFSELLTFFEQDTQEWAASRVSHEADTAAALGLVENLQSLLTEYRAVHDRALSISEERERSKRRDALQPAIVDALGDIDALMTGEPGGESAVSPTPTAGVAPRGPVGVNAVGDSPRPSAGPLNSTPQDTSTELNCPSSGQQHLPVVGSAASDVRVEIAEPQSFTEHEYEGLLSENSGLRDNAVALRSENQDLRDEVESLKAELFSSLEMEESWRMAYRSAINGAATHVEKEAPPQLDSVDAAVEMARNRYKQELLFAPNSESTIQDNPFIDPAKVWEALCWLATTYYASRMGRLRVTDFDQSIKEACGWWYKGDQGETTLSRYEKSYTTRVDGKRHWLAEHIGKGTTFDARYTIRIAFHWDRERRRVIVGYIGRHQQTDAS